MNFVLERTDGGIEIIQVLQGSVEDALAKWPEHRRAEIVAIRPLFTDLPADRTFRDAWRSDLSVDMTKARAIHRDCMRAARASKLAALDLDYQRADESADQLRKREIVRRKQELRDVTADPGIDAASTPDALKAVWPDCLK